MREELQKSKDDLQNSQAFLATAQKFTSIGSWDLDMKTGKVRCSEEMYKITGLDPAHLSSNYAFMANIIHPEDRQSVKKALRSALQGNGFCSIDYRAILPGGSQRTLSAEGEVQYHSDNQLYRITGMLYDATRQRNLEELQLINEREGFSILDINPDAVVIIDDDMRVQYINEAFEKMAGYLAKDVLGIIPPYPWWPADLHEKYAKELPRVIHGKIKKGEYLLKRKNGRNFWVRAAAKSLEKNGETRYHFLYMLDITEKKRLEENMQFYLTEITKVQEAERKRIAYEIHDDIIQSLASLSLQIDALGKHTNRPQDLPALLQGLRNGIQGLASRLRQFSHELHPGILDQGIIPALENLTQEISGETDIEIQFITYGNEQQLSVEMELCLFRIAQEALRNIVKHSGATEALVRLRYTSKGVKLIISDNGIGFEVPEVLGDLASKRKLGIIGMQERSRLLNGKFSLRSSVGKGTTVMAEAEVTK
jgi:PAS domain S-box-containing protein